MPTPNPEISIVIPTFNEDRYGFLETILATLAPAFDHHAIEIICVDSNSNDKTPELIKAFTPHYIATSEPSRGARLNIGVKAAQGRFILLHHPRSLLQLDAIEALLTLEKPCWGGFTHQFDDTAHYGLNYISWYSNTIRVLKRQIVYLDHCIFFHQDYKPQLLPIPNKRIFEDTEISYKLRQIAKPILLPQIALTSAIRFKTNGILKQYGLNQLLKILFFLKFPDAWLNALYEKNLPLNTEHHK